MVCHSDIKPAAIPLTTSNLPRLLHPFFTQCLDKQSLAHASVYGLPPDLDLPSKDYSWLLLLAILVSEAPFIYLTSRLPDSQVRRSDNHASGVGSAYTWPGRRTSQASPPSGHSLGFAEG